MKVICRDMAYIGAFRCVTIVLGLIALKYIAVSFVATIKSSSPLFTVLISRIILKERTSTKIGLSFFFLKRTYVFVVFFKIVGRNFR